MKNPKENKTVRERGRVQLAEMVTRLEKRVTALERARTRNENCPKIIPLDDETRVVYEQGKAELRAGYVIPAFRNMAEFKTWNEWHAD